MSTRFYPLYQKGNPQLRVFLPNFWAKIIKPELDQPSNIVSFAVSMEMVKILISINSRIINLKYLLF
jgi:large subunit ribosomal protein L23